MAAGGGEGQILCKWLTLHSARCAKCVEEKRGLIWGVSLGWCSVVTFALMVWYLLPWLNAIMRLHSFNSLSPWQS